MIFDIKHAPTTQELIDFDAMRTRTHKLELQKAKIGFIFSLAGILAIFFYFLYTLNSTGEHALFVDVACLIVDMIFFWMCLFSVQSLVKCSFNEPSHYSEKLDMSGYPSLLADLQTTESKHYIHMINSQGRDICYFDLDVIQKWENECKKTARLAQIEQEAQEAYAELRAI